MNMLRTSAARCVALALALPLAALFLAACDVGSADTTATVPSDNNGTIYNFAGLYMNPNNSTSTNGALPLVYPYEGNNHPSGEFITSLRLLQYGSALEAYDSEGLTWSGNISSIQSGTASFSLNGRTTAGQSVEIAGTMTYDNQKSTMDATWIEPAYYGSLFAQATVSPATTNTPVVEDVVIDPPSASLATNGATASFTASGGNGSYTWTYSGTGGSVSPSTGSTTRFTRTGSGGGSLKVTSGSKTDTATISCP